jgi:exopolysaccharide production protein ExoQ
VDVSVDEVRGGLTSWLPWRRELDQPAKRAGALARVHVAYRVARWELVLTVVALFIFGRTPLLFMRLHTTDTFWRVRALWQDDLVVVCAMAAAELALIAVAARRSSVDVLLRQPFLLAFVGFAWLSMAWSVEPDVTIRRSLLLAGAVGAGWYIGERFELRDQIRIASWLGWTAFGTTIVALFVWNDLARSTNGATGQWSGIYVNRNSLGLALSIGLLATLFFIRTTNRKGLVRTLAGFQFVVLGMTKSKTGVIGLFVALAVAIVVAWLRRRRSNNIGTIAAAYVVFAVFATVGLFVHWYWVEIIQKIGRQTDLTGRTFIWELVRWFSHLHPWRGWGFESIWANQHAISQAQAAHGSNPAALGKGVVGGWPFAAHNGYYEIVLGVGYLGLALFVAFLAFGLWRAFQYAWHRRDVESLWPLSFIVFAVVVNFSESLWVSGEATFVLTVAAAVAVVKITRSGRPPPLTAALGRAPAPTATDAPNGSRPAPRDVLRGRRG